MQKELESALHKVFRRQIDTLASGRTDTGVHALQQIVHIDIEEELTENHLYRLNSILPADIAVNDFYRVQPDAHARFDALSRAYEYRISKHKSPFLINEVWHFDRPLDVEEMNNAAALLLSYQNFQAFSKVHTDVKNFNCEIYFANWREKNDMLLFEIEANRFLRGMVRAIVGSLVPIGLGKSTVREFVSIIESADRRKAGAAAPPEGLFLTSVKYPDSIYSE